MDAKKKNSLQVHRELSLKATDCQMNDSLSFFDPGEVEPIVDAAGEKVDHPVGGLGACQIALGLGMGGVHREGSGPCTAVQNACLAVREEFLHRPCDAFVITQGHEQAVLAD